MDELDLECSHVSDGCLVKLQGLTLLRTLNLAETEVMDSGLCVVRKLTRLEVLNLRFTRVSDLGLDSLVGLTHLRELDLSFTPVTDAGLEQLTGLGALWDLDLSGTHVTAGGVRKLRRRLPMCDIASPWTSATHAARTGFGRGANVRAVMVTPDISHGAGVDAGENSTSWHLAPDENWLRTDRGGPATKRGQ